MKNKILILSTLVTILFVTQSCKKAKEESITETTNLTESIATNETFTIVLPETKNDEPYQITSQASHFTKSELSTDVNGNTVYTYTNAQATENVLTDDVVISNVREDHPPHPLKDHPHLFPPLFHRHPCDSSRSGNSEIINIHFDIK
jgi:hypothetical protein